MEPIESNDYHVIDYIIALISILLWPHSSTTQSNSIQPQVQQDTGSVFITGPKSLTPKPQVPSKSTAPTKSMVAQKKEAGGTNKAKPLQHTVSSVRNNASNDVLNSQKNTTYQNNHALVMDKILHQSQLCWAQDMHWIIPQNGLTIARY